MPTNFDRDTLQALDRTPEIDIETSRSDSAPVHRVTIWIVVDGDAAYVRSVRGPAGRWHRELLANPRGAIRVAGRRVAIQAVPVDDADTIARVSDALKRKYEQRWPGLTCLMAADRVAADALDLAHADMARLVADLNCHPSP